MTCFTRLLVLVVLAAPVAALAEETPSEREVWRAEIAAARARADAQREQLKADLAKRKAEMVLNPVSQDLERARRASDQVLGDYSLQQGDIVSTTDGLFVFVGSADGERSPGDFVPIAKYQPRR